MQTTDSDPATLTLTDFLLARIAEDEAIATLVTSAPAHWSMTTWPHDGAPIPVPAADRTFAPARLLAECEAKRRIVELHHDGDEHQCWEMHRGVYGPGWPEGSYAVESQPWAHPSLEGSDVQPGPCETLQLLALPYADHPDYRPEWRA